MTAITIQKMIAHYMDLNQTKPTLVDRTINIKNEDTAVINFFTDHIEKAFTTKQIKICKFKTEKSAVLKDALQICNDMNDTDLFVTATSEMTRRLFDFMKSSSSKSSGTMIYIIFNNVENGRTYLGILKMDPNKGIQYDPKKYSFNVQEYMLPNTKEKLHKTAFIKLDKNVFKEKSHLHVLDKQQRGDGVSKFFMTSFLEAEEVVNHKNMTEIVDKVLMEFAMENKISEGIQPLDFKQEIDAMLISGKKFVFDDDVDRLLKTYIPGEDDRENIIEEMKRRILVKNEDSYFEFPVVKEGSTIAYLRSVDKSINIQFPLSLKNKNIFIDESIDQDGKKRTTIIIKGEDLNESYK